MDKTSNGWWLAKTFRSVVLQLDSEFDSLKPTIVVAVLDGDKADVYFDHMSSDTFFGAKADFMELEEARLEAEEAEAVLLKELMES